MAAAWAAAIVAPARVAAGRAELRLPLRFQSAPGTTRVVTVDGSLGAPGLELSHWPGNRTPRALRHDLSTGIALAFARLPAAERADLAAGCEAVIINHIDTDGACALLAVVEPELALRHAALLLEAAAAGDRFRVPSRAGFRVDALLLGLTDPGRSPVPADVLATRGPRRDQALTEASVEVLRGLLLAIDRDGVEAAFEARRALWSEADEALTADQSDLGLALYDDLVHLDCAVWTAPLGSVSSRILDRASDRAHGGRVPCFDPGRHALFGSTRADRVLALGPSAAGPSAAGLSAAGPSTSGTTARFVIGTGSFFDVVDEVPSPRPDLAALCARLAALEAEAQGSSGSAEAAGRAWRHQSPTGASPELWYGVEGLPLYGEHAAPWLAPSALSAETIKAAVLDAVRATWPVPDDDDVAAPDEDIFAV